MYGLSCECVRFDLERSNQGHPQIKLNIFNFFLSTVTQIVLCIFSAPNISNSRSQLSTDCSHSPLVLLLSVKVLGVIRACLLHACLPNLRTCVNMTDLILVLISKTIIKEYQCIHSFDKRPVFSCKTWNVCLYELTGYSHIHIFSKSQQFSHNFPKRIFHAPGILLPVYYNKSLTSHYFSEAIKLARTLLLKKILVFYYE